MIDHLIIDYYGGAHGNFLERVCNRFLFDIESAQFSPFVESGASHLTTDAYIEDRKAVSDHYTFFDDPYPETPLKNTIVVNIFVDLPYQILYNSVLRAGDTPLDICTLEFDTLSKLTNPKHSVFRQTIIDEQGELVDYPREYLRNLFYSKFSESKYSTDVMNKFRDTDAQNYIFNASSFYDFQTFIKELGMLAKQMGKAGWTYNSELIALWDEFIQRNQGHHSYKKCHKIIDAILKNEYLEFECDLIEEAYINYYISKTFNVYDEISCFSADYPKNTQIIYSEIMNKISKHRNTL